MDKQVLIVDDAATNLKLLEILVNRLGCVCHPFIDTAECLRWAKNNIGQIDLCILDFQMPGYNGEQLSERLREFGYDGNIIILTALTNIRVEELSDNARITAVMNKPINLSDVFYMLKRWSCCYGETLDARREGRHIPDPTQKKELYLYNDGFYEAITVKLSNDSESGIGFSTDEFDSGLLKPGNELVCDTGTNFSIRWVKQGDDRYFVGACRIEDKFNNLS